MGRRPGGDIKSPKDAERPAFAPCTPRGSVILGSGYWGQIPKLPVILGSEPKSVMLGWRARTLCPELGSDPWTWGFAKITTPRLWPWIAASLRFSQ